MLNVIITAHLTSPKMFRYPPMKEELGTVYTLCSISENIEELEVMCRI